MTETVIEDQKIIVMIITEVGILEGVHEIGIVEDQGIIVVLEIAREEAHEIGTVGVPETGIAEDLVTGVHVTETEGDLVIEGVQEIELETDEVLGMDVMKNADVTGWCCCFFIFLYWCHAH